MGRMGRWIDFQNDYKTLYPWYMESLWWVFRQLWDKGLIYQGFRVMPYSTGCATPLSNFEATQNYKDVQVWPLIPCLMLSFLLKHTLRSLCMGLYTHHDRLGHSFDISNYPPCLVCRFIQELRSFEKMKNIVRSCFTWCKHTIRCEKVK